MSTVGELVDRVTNVWLESMHRPQYNAVDGTVGPADNEITTQFALGEIGKGSFIVVDDELMYVVDRSVAAQTLSVIRAVRGTTASAHAPGALIEISPRFPRFLIRQELRRELIGWGEAIYQAVAPITATLAVGQTQITALKDFADGESLTLFGCLQVRRASQDPTDDRQRPVAWDFDRATGTVQLRVPAQQDTTLALVGAFSFGSFPGPAWLDALNCQSDIGIEEQWEEILELGAAGRLLTGRQVPRLFPEAEGQSRSAQETTEVGMARLGQSYLKMRDDAIADATMLLYRRWGFTGVGTG